MRLGVTPLAPAIGAEISGIDLSAPLDPGTINAIRAAFHRHVVVVFRGQDLTEDAQFAFARHFGEIGVRKRSPNGATPGGDYDTPFMLVTNIVEDGKPIGSFGDSEMWFHHDTCYYEKPHAATLLYSVELPSRGGDTLFSNMYAAYDNVPDDLERRLEGRRVLQIHDYKRTERIDLDGDTTGMLQYSQPIFITHPDTGRRALYVNRLMSARIEGLDRAESDDILDRLFDIVEDPAIGYAHSWRLGDLVMWDNYASCHARTDFPRDEPRLLRRLTVEGGRALAF